MPYSSLFALKNGLIGSDGHRRKSGREGYSTVSKKLASDIIILCQYLGEQCSLNTKKATTSFFNDKKKGIIRPINCKESYSINFNRGRTNKIYSYNTDVVKYNGMVWCLEVENTHNFLVIRNGKICFSGNCTSELFGGMDYNRPETGYTEESAFHPRSPYSVAKLYGYWICKNYRESYNQFICNGILFNHTSPRRGENFVEKKIVDKLFQISDTLIWKKDKTFTPLTLGNLYSKRDIGYAKEYVEGMWLMLQQDKPDDYVLATNETYTIKDMVNYSLDYLNIEYYWKGEGLEEKCYQQDTDIVLVSIDEKYFRPAEVDFLLGDATKAKNILGWEAKTKLPDLLKIMIDDVLKK
jgi:GDP-mannose 4,6-dehydratase